MAATGIWLKDHGHKFGFRCCWPRRKPRGLHDESKRCPYDANYIELRRDFRCKNGTLLDHNCFALCTTHWERRGGGK